MGRVEEIHWPSPEEIVRSDKWVKAMLESYVDYGILFAIPFVLIEIIGVWVIGTPYQTFNEVLVCGGYLGVIIGCGSSLAAILTLEITSRINGEQRRET